jgi:tetratricopeptide (TPR) repeat protein
MLKALGLTIWGLIALGLLAIFIFVGYEVALKYRAAGEPTADIRAPVDHPNRHNSQGKARSAEIAEQTSQAIDTSAASRAPDATRKLLLDAARNHQYDSAIEYGRQLIEGKAAEPSDLSIVAQSYLSVGNCAEAQMWARRGKDAYQAAGLQPDDALHHVTECCGPGGSKTRLALDPVLNARMVRFVNKSDAAKSDSGSPLVRLGELYYGFGEYDLAIVSIKLGLEKGKIAHLDEAYVYLGRAALAVGDVDEARNAFNMLKDVPGISPRVLRLWTLYAQTRLSGASPQTALENGNCPTTPRADRNIETDTN